MALLKFEHFDLYGTDVNALLANGYTADAPVVPLILASPGRTGPRCMQVPDFGYQGRLIYTLPSSASTLGVGVAMKVPPNISDGDGTPGVYVNYQTGTVKILVGSDNRINIYEGNTLINQSAPNVFVSDSWFYMEVKLVSGTGDATVEVRLNGSNTAAVTATSRTFGNLTQALIGQAAYDPAAKITLFDDLVVWDATGSANNNFMGDCAVVIAAPDADTAVDDWIPSSGSDLYAMVDEETPNDADYISASDVNDAEELDHVDPTLPAGSVKAVATQVRAFKADAGASSITIGVDSDGTDSVSGNIVLATGAASYSYILDLDPDGNVAWTNVQALAAKTRVVKTV
jgi:hypothetical protein